MVERSGSANEAGAHDLAKALGGLALACEQAGAFCARTGRSVSDYLMLFEASPAKALAWEMGSPTYPNSVARTFALAIDKAAGEVPAAAPMLSVIAHLAAAPVPLAVFGHDAAPEGLRDRIEAAEAEAALVRWALADPAKVTDPLRKVDVRCLSLHRLVREAARAQDAGRDNLAFVDSIRSLSGAYRGREVSNETEWPLCKALEPHADPAWAETKWDVETADAARRTLNCAASFDQHSSAAYAPYSSAAYSRAAPYERALDKSLAALSLAEVAHGDSAVETALQLANLAEILSTLGGVNNLSRARGALERAIRIDGASYGAHHPSISTHLYNLADVLRALGGAENLNHARDALESAIRIDEAAHGPDHPEVATHLSNLATVLGELGGAENLNRARDALERAPRIDETAHGPDHPNVAIRLSNLANVLRDLGGAENLNRARDALERAIRIDEAAHGPDHPSVAAHLSNLANVLRDLGGAENLNRARDALERALRTEEAALGPDHPNVGITCGLLARICMRIGGAEDLARARDLADRSVAILEAALGPDHPHTAAARSIRDDEVGGAGSPPAPGA